MTESAMCDPNARIWCGRIGLLFTVCAVLCTMIYQIWSYYFSLVEQMDAYVIESPRVHAFFSVCDKIVKESWNVECNTFTCTYPDTEFKTYVDASNMFRVNSTHISFGADTCGSVWIWILPW